MNRGAERPFASESVNERLKPQPTGSATRRSFTGDEAMAWFNLCFIVQMLRIHGKLRSKVADEGARGSRLRSTGSISSEAAAGGGRSHASSTNTAKKRVRQEDVPDTDGNPPAAKRSGTAEQRGARAASSHGHSAATPDVVPTPVGWSGAVMQCVGGDSGCCRSRDVTKNFPIHAAVDFRREYSLVPRVRRGLLGLEEDKVFPAHEVVQSLVAEKRAWFIMYGPPRCGKTTAIRWSMDKLQEAGSHVCIYCSLRGLDLPEENTSHYRAHDEWDLDLLNKLVTAVEAHQSLGHLSKTFDASGISRELRLNDLRAGIRFKSFLGTLSQFVKKKEAKDLVVCIDEMDTLGTVGVDQPPWMASFLASMRALHSRQEPMRPTSMVFCGLYDVRKVELRGSPFNIANRTVQPVLWSEEDLRGILQQFVNDSGRTVEGGAVQEIRRQSGGHPWTCNYIMHQLTDTADDRITVSDVEDAVEEMIRERMTGIRSLETRIKEDERVRRAVMGLVGGPGCYREDMEVAVDVGIVYQVIPEGFRFVSTIVRDVSFRFLADRIAPVQSADVLAELRRTYVFADRVDWVELFRIANHHAMRTIVTSTIRSAKRTAADNLFYDMTSFFYEEYYTNVAAAALSWFIDEDGFGSVRTKEMSPHERPNHQLLLARYLPVSRTRKCALVENKRAKPVKAGEPVPQEAIDAKVKEAVETLARYYPTYSDIDAVLAVVHAPSAAFATLPQFSSRELTVAEVEEMVGDEDPFKGKPCHVIAIRYDLLQPGDKKPRSVRHANYVEDSESDSEGAESL